MPLNTFFQNAGRMFKSGIGLSTSTNGGVSRVDKAKSRIEGMRKASIVAKNSAVRGAVQTSSSRDILKRQLGRDPGARTGGTSLGRMGSNSGSNNMSNMSGGGGATPMSNFRPPTLPKR